MLHCCDKTSRCAGQSLLLSEAKADPLLPASDVVAFCLGPAAAAERRAWCHLPSGLNPHLRLYAQHDFVSATQPSQGGSGLGLRLSAPFGSLPRFHCLAWLAHGCCLSPQRWGADGLHHVFYLLQRQLRITG